MPMARWFQTIDAGPGQVDLNQIPALSLTSAITIILEDSTGRRELDSFTLANDIELLEQGLNEFNLAIGMLRSPSDRGVPLWQRSHCNRPVRHWPFELP